MSGTARIGHAAYKGPSVIKGSLSGWGLDLWQEASGKCIWEPPGGLRNSMICLRKVISVLLWDEQ
ncbi:hypothetical protein Leryth_025254 [Lithospermum erythrorhizon]|nr:hypothetical protein Leryth_025254 [Lithospermum erythrorhizon]